MNKSLLESLKFKYHPHHKPTSDTRKQSETEVELQTVERKSIKVLTYNLYMRPPPVKTNASDHKDARLEEFAKKLNDFDIICNQEVFSTLNSRKQRLISYAQKSGLIYHTSSEQPSFFSGYATDGGLVILSRFPIVYSEFSPYPFGVLSDSLSYKGVLYAKIAVGDGRILHIFNTHT